MADKKWIQGAISNPGALTRKARRAGKTIEEFCAGDNLTPEDIKQCNLAKNLSKMHGGAKK